MHKMFDLNFICYNIIKYYKKISIEVSYELIKNEWSYFCFERESFIGSRNRELQKLRKQKHIRNYKTFNVLSDSSKSLILHEPINFLSKSYFSKALLYFTDNSSQFGLPENDDTEMIIQIQNQF